MNLLNFLNSNDGRLQAEARWGMAWEHAREVLSHDQKPKFLGRAPVKGLCWDIFEILRTDLSEYWPRPWLDLPRSRIESVMQSLTPSKDFDPTCDFARLAVEDPPRVEYFRVEFGLNYSRADELKKFRAWLKEEEDAGPEEFRNPVRGESPITALRQLCVLRLHGAGLSYPEIGSVVWGRQANANAESNLRRDASAARRRLAELASKWGSR